MSKARLRGWLHFLITLKAGQGLIAAVSAAATVTVIVTATAAATAAAVTAVDAHGGAWPRVREGEGSRLAHRA